MARRSARRARGRRVGQRRWSQRVTATSNALDLEHRVFAQRSPRAIAASLKRSSERSRRRRATPFQSAMSMLNFYINRAGRSLPAKRRRTLDRAKEELRRLFRRTQSVAVLLAGLAIACGGRSDTPAPAVSPEEHAQKVQAWRDKHEQDYRRDWVSVAGLHFLEPGTHTVGSGKKNDIVLAANVPNTIGRLEVTGEGGVRYLPSPEVPVKLKGQPVSGQIVLREAGKPPSPEVMIGDVRLVAHLSGGRAALRVRDPNGALARDFRGFRWFPIDSSHRVTGRFIRDTEPRELTVLNTLNDADSYTSEGVVEFELQGRTLRLRPFTTRPNRFYFVFRDGSSGEETYKTARFLYSDLLPDGTTILDFNEAYNPPCAFNPYTTCPIPLKENVLPVKVLAGEKAYAAR